MILEILLAMMFVIFGVWYTYPIYRDARRIFLSKHKETAGDSFPIETPFKAMEKIGIEYSRRGYGRTAPRRASIYLLGGYAYARDKKTWETDYNQLKGELSGFVRVNARIFDGAIKYYHVCDYADNDKHIALGEAELKILFEKDNHNKP